MARGRPERAHASPYPQTQAGQGQEQRGTAAYRVFYVSSTDMGPCNPLFCFILMAPFHGTLIGPFCRGRNGGSLLRVTRLERGGHGLELGPASVHGRRWVSPSCTARVGELLSSGWARPRPTACKCDSMVMASTAARCSCGNRG